MSAERKPDIKSVARGGASVHRVGTADLWRSYLGNHLRVARQSLGRLLSTPIATLMTLLVLAIAFTLPSVLFVGLKNVQALAGHWQGSTQVTLFLSPELGEVEGRDLAVQLQANDQIAESVYVSQQQALEEFRQFSGFSAAIDTLDSNPLPAVILLQPAADYLLETQLLSLQQQLLSVDGIEDVQLDMAWVQRLLSITELAQRLVIVLTTLLGLAVLLVVGNTIRLEIENRREEIQVVKLVGGTDGFVQRPFLYTGFWYGLLAGLLAWALVQSSLWYLSVTVDQLIGLYQSQFQLLGLSLAGAAVLLAGGILVGVGGAWLAVVRHLKSIEP